MKYFIHIVFLFILLDNLFCQDLKKMNYNELENLKKKAVQNQDYDFAQKIKDEQNERKKIINIKNEYNEQLKKAVADEDYRYASELKGKIVLLEELDSLERKQRQLSKLSGLEVQKTISSNILDIRKKLGFISNENQLGVLNHEDDVKRIDTLYYNADWKGVESFNECTYIRIIKIDSKGQIINPVEDYFDTWDKAGIGEAISINSQDDSKSVWGGVVEVFSLSGETTFKKDYRAIKKTIYREGKEIFYYAHNNIIVTLQLELEKNYGKYYVAYLKIINYNNSQFDFDPTDVKVFFKEDDYVKDGVILSHEEFMQKVKNKQAWASALVAFGEFTQASTAGYNTTSYNSSEIGGSNTISNVNGFAYDNRGNVVSGSAHGYSNTFSYKNTRGTETTYNSSENYFARQNALNNINNFNDKQFEIKNNINRGYLKKNTIFSGEQIYGNLNIVFEKNDIMILVVPVNGFSYMFEIILQDEEKPKKQRARVIQSQFD